MLPWLNVTITDDGIKLGAVLNLLLDILSTKFNFKYTLMLPPDNEWGQKKVDGNWTGMVGMILRDEADMILGPFAETLDRFQVLRFTSSYFTSGVIMVAGGLGENSNPQNIFSFFQAFEWQVWAGLVTSVIGVICVLNYLDKVDPDNTTALARTDGKNGWTILGSLFCESAIHEPKRSSSQILLGVWWLAVVVLMNSFTGQMKASMTIEQEKDRLNNINDLVTRTKLPAILPRGTAFADLFKYGYTSDFKEVWRRTEKSAGVVLMKQLVSPASFVKVKKGKAVIISEESTLRFALSRVCLHLPGAGELYIAKERIFPHDLAVAMRKGVPLNVVEAWSYGIMAMESSGLMSKWLHDIYGPWRCDEAGDQQEKSITIKEFGNIIFVMFVLYGICILTFIQELIEVRKHRGRRLENKTSPKRVKKYGTLLSYMKYKVKT